MRLFLFFWPINYVLFLHLRFLFLWLHNLFFFRLFDLFWLFGLLYFFFILLLRLFFDICMVDFLSLFIADFLFLFLIILFFLYFIFFWLLRMLFFHNWSFLTFLIINLWVFRTFWALYCRWIFVHLRLFLLAFIWFWSRNFMNSRGSELIHVGLHVKRGSILKRLYNIGYNFNTSVDINLPIWTPFMKSSYTNFSISIFKAIIKNEHQYQCLNL